MPLLPHDATHAQHTAHPYCALLRYALLPATPSKPAHDMPSQLGTLARKTPSPEPVQGRQAGRAHVSTRAPGYTANGPPKGTQPFRCHTDNKSAVHQLAYAPCALAFRQHTKRRENATWHLAEKPPRVNAARHSRTAARRKAKNKHVYFIQHTQSKPTPRPGTPRKPYLDAQAQAHACNDKLHPEQRAARKPHTQIRILAKEKADPQAIFCRAHFKL